MATTAINTRNISYLSTKKSTGLNFDPAPYYAVIAALMLKYGKDYCFPTGETWLKLLHNHHNINHSMRTLWRRLKALELYDSIKRIRRIKKGSDGNPLFRSTIYRLKVKALIFLKKFGERFSVIQKWLDRTFTFREEKARTFVQAPKSGKPVQYSKESLLAQEMARQYERNEPPLPLEENLRRLSLLRKALS